MTEYFELEWQKFQKKDEESKLGFFQKEGRIFDVLFARQFDRKFLNALCDLATKTRLIAKRKEGSDYLRRLLTHKKAMLYFVQPSTRTYLSFLNACHILGIKTSDIRDTFTSSEIKGESGYDTIRTFSSYVDVIISRHPEKDFNQKAAWLLNSTDRPIPVVNAGSGKDEHPTQALLDIYTLHRSFENQGGIDGKVITMVGDLKRGRTVRSLSVLMKEYKNMKLYFVSPKHLMIEDDLRSFLKKSKIEFYETDDFASVIPKSDAIYMTRIQDEHDTDKEKTQGSYPEFSFTYEHLPMLGKHAIIMHPLPRRNELDVRVDSDERAMYWRQERNGMWIRAALLAYVFHVEKSIIDV